MIDADVLKTALERISRRVWIAASIVIFVALTIGAIVWIRSPRVPNVAKMDVDDAVRFIGTDDFNRLSESRRKAYVISIADKLRDKKFKDLVGLMLTNDPNRRGMAQNVGKLSKGSQQEIGSAFMRVFLDKFYELTNQERETYMLGWVLLEKAGGSRATTKPTSQPSDKQPRLPTAAEVEKGMTDFMSNQPPKTVAQMGELMNSMGKKRRALGVKEPF